VWCRYAEVPINSSAVIYHYLKMLPFSTYGENVAVLIQNLICVGLVWVWEVPRVKMSEVVLVTLGFIVLCTVQLNLPPSLHPLLIYINMPLVLSSCLPQIVANFRQGHTGQLAILSNFLKLVGCVVRIFTTITQIGLDMGLLANYGIGALMNLILVTQGMVYREKVWLCCLCFRMNICFECRYAWLVCSNVYMLKWLICSKVYMLRMYICLACMFECRYASAH
jgi:mannose-P-dolichol utilization defect protein 1